MKFYRGAARKFYNDNYEIELLSFYGIILYIFLNLIFITSHCVIAISSTAMTIKLKFSMEVPPLNFTILQHGLNLQ